MATFRGGPWRDPSPVWGGPGCRGSQGVDIVSVSCGCRNTSPRALWLKKYKPRNVFPHSFESQKSKVRVSAGLVPSGRSEASPAAWGSWPSLVLLGLGVRPGRLHFCLLMASASILFLRGPRSLCLGPTLAIQGP